MAVVRIMDGAGTPLDWGIVEWEESDQRRKGILRVLVGSAVAGKALKVRLQLEDGGLVDAVLDPLENDGEYATLEVVGASPPS